MVTARGRPRLGQNFLADPNLLDAIVRHAEPAADDVVLEVGGGMGALTERLAPQVAHLHVVELDERLRPELDAVADAAGNVGIVWGDAMRLDLNTLDPPPTKLVANLPYSIATPVLLRTIEELPGLQRWVVMVQRQIADRLLAAPGNRTYGSPSVLVQLACEVEMLRPVGRRVFRPAPRVDSALIGLRRRAPAAPAAVRSLVKDAFAHRRKALARSVELARPGSRDRVRGALEGLGLDPRTRAEALAPRDFERLVDALADSEGGRSG
jgi:16S rRNA (adenine1518-N6/adenine1519-N6)-dimethyltransferase